MGPVTLLGERRVAGFLLLVAGFATLVVAALLYGDGTYPAGHAWQSNALTVGLVLTLLSLTAFQVVLTDAGDDLLARLGTIAYLVGVVTASGVKNREIEDTSRASAARSTFSARPKLWIIFATGLPETGCRSLCANCR